MSRRRLHFVNRYFYPDHSATSQLLADLAFHLAAKEVDVHVITSRQRYDDPAARLPPDETVQGVRVRRVASSTFGRTTLPGRAFDYVTFYVTTLLALLMSVRRGDTVVALTDPPLISVIAAIACRVRGAELVNWVQDLFPEVAEAAGMRTARVLAPLRNWSLRAARLNVALSDGMAARLAAIGAIASVQHNWPDGAIAPVSRETNQLRRALVPGNDFCVEYSGNLGRAHDVATILEAVRRSPQTRFLFIGGGSGMADLKQAISSQANVTFAGYQPRETLSQSLSIGDVHLVSLAPEFDTLVVPSKMYGIMAAGRPIILIGAPGGDSAGIVDDVGCGIVVAAGDAPALCAAIELLRRDEALRARMGAAALLAVHDRFRRELALHGWESLLEVRT